MIDLILAIFTENDKIIWSKYVKLALIIALAIILEALVLLLVLELVGKMTKRVLVVQSQELVNQFESTVDELDVQETENLPENESEIAKNDNLSEEENQAETTLVEDAKDTAENVDSTDEIEYIVPERDFEILTSVNSTDTAELMETEIAIANIESKIVDDFEVEYSDDSYKTIINVDTLCKSFHSGENVNIEKMKKKNLIEKKATYVKVLARGILDKPLIVVADSFSIEATKMILLTGGRVIQKRKNR